MEKEVKNDAKAETGKVAVTPPTGAGRFNDMVTVKGTDKHPTLKGKEYRVHSAHVPYLKSRGFIAENVSVPDVKIKQI